MSCLSELKKEFKCQKFGTGFQFPSKFVLSQCGPRILYPIWTSLWIVYHLGWIGYDIYDKFEGDKNWDFQYFSKLTNWGYNLLVIANFFDAVFVLYTHCKRPDIFADKDIEQYTPWYLQMNWILFEIMNTTGIIISILYYGLLDPKSDPLSVEYHAINAVYILLNFFVCAKPVRILHFVYPSILGALFSIWSVIDQNYVSKSLVYGNILNWIDKPENAAGFCVILVIVVVPIVHFVFFCLYKLRVFVSEKCCSSGEYTLERKYVP